jgi:hypothetical protein
MKKLLIGLALGTAASLAVRKIADEGHKLHEHCRELMGNHCHGSHADGGQEPADGGRWSCPAARNNQDVGCEPSGSSRRS